ncbi:MAG: 30S ribosomal protein S27ae [Candidatus Bathyarchaeia archaeon]|jgi:small subunit ribosomal protein S27Ae
MSKKVAKKEDKPAAAPKKEEAKPAVAAEAAPAAKPQKAEKKREKRHREEKGVHAMYKVEGDKVSRARPTCERCGPGYFMADHHDRYTCGHCGFTRYKQK